MDLIWLIVLAVAVGYILLLVEVLTPSFGLLTVLAILCFGVAVWLCFRISTVAGIVMIGALVVTIPLYYWVLFRYVARTAFARKLFLDPGKNTPGQGAPALDSYRQCIGKQGVSLTQLRPAGAIRIDGRRLDAVAESGLIEKGKNVKVLRVTGSSLVVKEV